MSQYAICSSCLRQVDSPLSLFRDSNIYLGASTQQALPGSLGNHGLNLVFEEVGCLLGGPAYELADVCDLFYFGGVERYLGVGCEAIEQIVVAVIRSNSCQSPILAELLIVRQGKRCTQIHCRNPSLC